MNSIDLARPCSWLYHVRPLGVKTGEVESLSGYIARVARAHCVTPSDLLHRALEWWDMGMPERVGEWRRKTARLKLSGSINAHSTGGPWVELLQQLGNMEGLAECTVAAWGSVLPQRGLLRTCHAWCPECFKTDEVPYHRLLWALRGVRVCPRHRCRLIERCPECRSRIPVLHTRSSPGHCPHCTAKLADAVSESNPVTDSEITFAQITTDFLQCTAENRAAIRPIEGDVVAGLQRCVAAASISDASELAGHLNVSRITAWYWLHGRATPGFENLIGICQTFRLSAADFLAGEIPTVIELNPRDELPLRLGRRMPRTFDAIRVFGEIRRLLESAAAEPPSLEEIGRQTGFAPRVLRRHFSVLCREISARHKAHSQTKIAERRAALREEFRAAIRLSKARYGTPTRPEMVRLLPKPGVLRSLAARREFDQLRLQLE